MHAWGLRLRRAAPRSRCRAPRCCLPVNLTLSAPMILVISELTTSGYPAYMCLPPTLQVRPCGRPRMGRGQDGSLLLSCMTLSFTTSRRFIPTLSRLATCGRFSIGLDASAPGFTYSSGSSRQYQSADRTFETRGQAGCKPAAGYKPAPRRSQHSSAGRQRRHGQGRYMKREGMSQSWSGQGSEGGSAGGTSVAASWPSEQG